MYLASATNAATDVAVGSPASGGNETAVQCHHCGLPCTDGGHEIEEKHFCCRGCLTVFELLTANGLDS
jgi:hypothetical protein